MKIGVLIFEIRHILTEISGFRCDIAYYNDTSGTRYIIDFKSF